MSNKNTVLFGMSAKVVQDCLLEPVTSDTFISSLRDLAIFLKSCIGPQGMPKLLVSSGNYIQLTSCSDTLADRLDLQNPVCRYILQAIKAQPDFGLYVGLFICSILEQIWTIQSKDQFETICVIKAVEHFTESCNSLLSSIGFALTIDFSSAKELVSIAKNIIFCKQFLFLPETYVDDLSLNIVKAFLMSIDSNDFTVNRILVKAEYGSNEVNCYYGILYQIIEKEEQLSFDKVKNSNLSVYNIILFSIMLTQNEKKSTTLSSIFQCLQSIVDLGINIVASQKVVQDSIKLFLRRNGVLLLERLGTNQTSALKKITNATPISDVSRVTAADIGNMKGYLTSIDIITFNKKKYFLLENNKSAITTIAFCTSSLAGENEVKVVVEQALETLKSIAKDPRVVPGAGCFEMQLLLQVTKLFKNKVDKIIVSAFQKAVISASGLQPSLSFDTIHNHAWSSESLDLCKCNCGVITKSYITSKKGDWIPMDQYNFSSHSQVLNFRWENFLIRDGVILDSFSIKQNALMSALEVCVNLLSIGLVVYKND